MGADVFFNENLKTTTELIKISEDILFDMQTDISKKDSIRLPIAELAILGSTVASILPSMRTITQTTTVNTQGLFKLANAGVGDALKAAKNGNFWGAFKTMEGKSKLVQLESVTDIPATMTTVLPIDPATILLAVTLFAIEHEMGAFAETNRHILSFLKREKESKIEADMVTLSNMLTKYKSNWDNEHFVASHHKLAVDIQRTARANIISYQKEVKEMISEKEFIFVQSKIMDKLESTRRMFEYYRLSLYVFSMASLCEVLLSGNFKASYIGDAINEINAYSLDYREIFTRCSIYLEELSNKSLEKNFLKGMGVVSDVAGNIIGNIPLVKEGKVDEFLIDSGEQLKKNASAMESNLLKDFSLNSNPGIYIFVDKLNDILKIYNDTTEIYFDDKYIYLTA